MTDLENELTAALYRINCPDSTELGEYHLGLVGGSRAAFIDQHLNECPYCSREVAQLASFLAQVESDLDFSAADRIKIWIARLAPEFPAGSGAATPALGFRGDAGETGSGRSLIFEAGDAQLMIDVQDDPGDASRKSLIGLIIGVDPVGLEARLWLDGRPAATAGVDDLGNFAFPDLKPGHYELIVTGPGMEIHVQELFI